MAQPTPNTPPSGKPPAAAKTLAPMTQKLLPLIDELLGLHKHVEDALKTPEDQSLSAEDKDAIKRYEEGLQKMLDLIAPAGMKIERNKIVLNEEFLLKSYFAYNWPSQLYPGWISQLINYDAKMEISQFIYPASSKTILRVLRKKVAEMRSSIRILQQRGIVRDPALEAALQDAEELRDILARGREKLYQFGLYITIYADDEEKLKKIQTDMESLLGGKLILTKPAAFQMEHGWTSCLPLALDELDISRNMNTSPIGTSFPFSSPDLTDDHGILYGVNRHNDSLVIFDRFDLPNANCNVFATSGAGKSYTVKLELLRAMMYGTEVYVIDPENEYSKLCETVGGSYIPISLQSSHRINPFDLPGAVRGEEAETGEVLRSAIINLHGLLKLMLGMITPSEEGILDKALLDTYALRGITMQTPDPAAVEPPTLADLIDVLTTSDGGEHMAQTLKKYTEGTFSGLFDRKTNIALDKQMIVFQIRDLEDTLRPIAMYVILNYLWNRIRTDMKRRLLVIDEAWNLMQHEDSARFLYGLIKRARKYYLGVTTITQDIEDFVNSQYGKPIVTNTSLQILLKQSPTAVDQLQKLFFLTEGEKYLLLSSGVGQGILFADKKHVAIQVVASPEEHRFVTTNPAEVMMQKQREEEAKSAEITAAAEKQVKEEEQTHPSQETLPDDSAQ